MQPHPIEYTPHPDEPSFDTDPEAWLAWTQDPEVIDIYAIHAKGDTSQVWYIGQSNSVAVREAAHRGASNTNARLPLYRWLAEHDWELTSIETVRTRNAARAAERRWIKHYAAINPGLFNVQGNRAQAAPSALETLRATVESRGGTVHTDLVVLISRTGEVTLARWEGAELQKIKPTDLVSGNE